jgi:hypothetical protein
MTNEEALLALRTALTPAKETSEVLFTVAGGWAGLGWIATVLFENLIEFRFDRLRVCFGPLCLFGGTATGAANDPK